MDLKATFKHVPIFSEMLMMESVKIHEALNKKRNALMRVYTNRFLHEHPDLIVESFKPLFAESIKVNNLAGLNRSEFFQRVYPTFARVDWDTAFKDNPGGIRPVT